MAFGFQTEFSVTAAISTGLSWSLGVSTAARNEPQVHRIDDSQSPFDFGVRKNLMQSTIQGVPMRAASACLLTLIAFVCFVSADESKKAKPKPPDEIVKAGIMQFHERMRSDDPKVRDKEFDAVMPDKKTIEKLFGDDANLVWPRLSEGMKQMRASSDKAKEEFDRQGKIISIEVIDLRKDDASGRYRRLLQMIPKDIPVYRAVMKYEKGSGGSSSYLVIDGNMRFVRGLEGIAEFIDERNKAKK